MMIPDDIPIKINEFRIFVTKLSDKYNWEEGKLKTFLSTIDLGFSIYTNISEKSEKGTIDDEFLKIFQSIGFELFNLKERVRYILPEGADKVVSISGNTEHLNNKFFTPFIQNEIGDEFSENLQFVISEVLSEFTDKYNHFEINDKLDNLEDELVKNQISDSSFLVNFLLSSKIEMIDRLFSKIFPPFMKNNEWLIEDKIDLIIRIVTHLEGSLKEDKQLVPFSTFSFFGKSITISKSTSDKYCIFFNKGVCSKTKRSWM